MVAVLLHIRYHCDMSTFIAFAVWQVIIFAIFLRGCHELDETSDTYTDLGEEPMTDDEPQPREHAVQCPYCPSFMIGRTGRGKTLNPNGVCDNHQHLIHITVAR